MTSEKMKQIFVKTLLKALEPMGELQIRSPKEDLTMIYKDRVAFCLTDGRAAYFRSFHNEALENTIAFEDKIYVKTPLLLSEGDRLLEGATRSYWRAKDLDNLIMRSIA